MNRKKALSILRTEAAKYAGRRYKDLIHLIDNSINETVLGPDGAEYQIEAGAVWDDMPNGQLRLFFSIDNGGFSAYWPVSRSSLIAIGQAFDGQL